MKEQTLVGAQSSTPTDATADWAKERQRMTDGQRWHLRFLSAEAREVMNESLTKAEAAKKINELQVKLYRGKKKPCLA